MTMIPNPLSVLLLVPTVGLGLVLLTPSHKTALIRKITNITLLLPFLLSIWIFAAYDATTGGYQFVQKIPWVSAFGIFFHIGVDGINSLMLILVGAGSFTAVLISDSIKERVKEYYALILLMVIGTYAAFCSLDIFFFFLLHEIATIPTFLLIGIWGSQRRDYAAMKITLYLTAGASLALIGLIALYYAAGLGTFDSVAIQQYLTTTPLPVDVQNVIFPLIVVGFGITLTLWPFHTWAPVAYAEAPTAVSMLHAGVIKKLGAYAIIRFAIQLMPDAAHTWMPIIGVLGIVNILFCGFIALTQRDMKYIVAYSSCSHVGYIFLGLAALNVIGLNGVVFLMFAHGIMAVLAFALTGYIEGQTKSRNLDEWGGLLTRMPFIGTCFMMAAFASAGVPGFGNFVAEMLVLLGSWDQYRWLTILAVLGIVITAIYMLKSIRLGFHGPLLPKLNNVSDATTVLAKLPFIILLAILMVVGCFPSLILKNISAATKTIIVSK